MWRVYALLSLFSLCACARAQEICPWLTQGTAAALLGEDVQVHIHVSAGEGDCEFVPRAGGDPSGAVPSTGKLMTIVVSHQSSKECATGERLAGIGEDSIFCEADVEGSHRETIRGRVRSKYFLLMVTSRKTSASDNASLRHSLEQVAEEVAGNLF